MKILVVGGNGFIGSHVVDRLIANGHRVTVLDRQPERFRPPVPSVDYRFAQFTDRMALLDAIAGMDVVMHLVSTTFPGTADLDPKTDVQDNLIGTIALIEAMLGTGVTRLVYLSSGGTVYGVPEQIPIPETHPHRPINSYGIVKSAIEHYIGLFCRTRGLSAAIIRPSNPYGPRQGHTGVQGVVSTFLRRVLTGEPIEIWGDGLIVRDYLHVTDLAAFCATVAGHDAQGAFNAGSGVGTTVNQIVDIVAAVTGTDLQVIRKPGRAIDVPQSVLDVTQARAVFDWETAITLRDGVADTWKWMQSQKT